MATSIDFKFGTLGIQGQSPDPNDLLETACPVWVTVALIDGPFCFPGSNLSVWNSRRWHRLLRLGRERPRTQRPSFLLAAPRVF